jgi:hypothetical protein
MSGRILIRAIELFVASLCALASTASAADYRGAAAGWPTYANGTYAAGYPANYAADPYYVARPVAATTSAGYAPTGTMYMPATAAYANPTYFAAYGRSPTMYRPVSVGYAPTAGGYYAQTANYAPVTANYAPANSYAVTPAGIMAGSEAAAYFGQPYPLNYVPPRVTYRPTYSAVPVYMYRPMTAYQPVPYQPGAVQPVTCMQPSMGSTCMPQARRCGSGFSWLNPFTWFHRSSSCCGYAPPTTAYCGTGCGQPYYPTAPIVPVMPTVPVVPPTNIIPAQPGTYIPRAGTTIPPPPTMAPGTRFPADIAPSLAPRGGATIQPSPGGSFSMPIPGGQTPLPQGGFQQPGFQQPGFQQPGVGGSQIVPSQPPIGGGQGSFPSGTNYPPSSDPYNSTLTPVNPGSGAGGNNASPSPNSGSMQAGPSHSVFGSGYRGTSDGVIRAPELQPALPQGVQSVPDPDAQESTRPLNSVPGNSAPKLLDPRDKTAGRDPRWAVVPALWPTKAEPYKPAGQASGSAGGQLSARPVAPTKAYQASAPLSASPYAASQAGVADYDDQGWKTAAF